MEQQPSTTAAGNPKDVASKKVHMKLPAKVRQSHTTQGTTVNDIVHMKQESVCKTTMEWTCSYISFIEKCFLFRRETTNIPPGHYDTVQPVVVSGCSDQRNDLSGCSSQRNERVHGVHSLYKDDV
ncbi:hypothetical protein IV203_012849 [Nitzschia inconspicua]|uniref:Uncharacterized protein n=1 Tax=Nitzschia inconspicua TaxID=303405 RepID=A0A9K3Q9S5_9STRA|nr:hypothetical protein IV203_012849 [Nitzschia inconspicua]